MYSREINRLRKVEHKIMKNLDLLYTDRFESGKQLTGYVVLNIISSVQFEASIENRPYVSHFVSKGKIKRTSFKCSHLRSFVVECRMQSILTVNVIKHSTQFIRVKRMQSLKVLYHVSGRNEMSRCTHDESVDRY